jgi:hypothetical protein
MKLVGESFNPAPLTNEKLPAILRLGILSCIRLFAGVDAENDI